MEKLIDEVIDLQQGILTNSSIRYFTELKTLPLEELEKRIAEEQNRGNIRFITVIGHILEYGTLKSNLDNKELSSLEERIIAKDELLKIKRLLTLFEELRNYIEASIINNPMTQEHFAFKKMKLLASKQDDELKGVTESYPSSFLWLPTDDEKIYLTSIYANIKQFKNVDHRLFLSDVIPDIELLIKNSKTAASLDCLQRYLDGKNRTLSNLDDEIKDMHIKASKRMNSASEEAKSLYLATTKELATEQQDFQTLTRKIEMYKNPQR